MPTRRPPIGHVRYVGERTLGQHHLHGVGCKRIPGSCNVGKNTVLRCLQRTRPAGLGRPLTEGLDDAQLEAMLWAMPTLKARRPVPDWSAVERESQRSGMTRR